MLKSVKNMEGHVVKLTQELSECQEVNRKQTQEILQLKRRLDHAGGLEEQLTRLTMSVSTLEEQNKELQKQLQLGSPIAQAAVDSHDHSYQQRLRDEIERLRPLEERSMALEQQLKAAQHFEQQYHEAIDEISQLNKEIVSLKAEMQEQVIPPAGNMADSKDEVSKFRTQLKLKEETILRLQVDLEASQKMARELNRVKEHSKKQSREVMQLKHEQTAFEVNERERSGYEQSLIDSVRTLEDENMKLLDDLQGANKDRWYLKEALATAVTKKEELVTQVQLLEAQMDGLGPKEESARQQLKSLTDSYRTMQQKYQEMKAENQKLLQQIKKLHTLSEENVQLERMNDQLRTDIREQSANRQQLQQRHHDVLAQLQEMRSQRFEFWKISPKDVEVLPGEEHVVGRGAWGSVVKGIFRGQRVAVKCLHQAIRDPRTVERVNREICTMAQVRHPNLVLFLAAIYEQGHPPMIVTELLDVDLRTAYETGRLQDSSKLAIFRDVACALNYLHQHCEPIIHRDVSAPNVLLEALAGGVWKAKVSDFGSANLARYSKTLAEGAIAYAAPETYPQRPGARPLPQTTKIDVYSYGVLLCEVIISEIPEPDQLRLKTQDVRKQWLSMYNLIDSCIQWKATNRPTMAKILTDLPQPLLRMHSSS